IDAAEAHRIGLVNHVVTDDQVVERALELAAQIAQNGGQAIRMAKAAMNALARPHEGIASSLESIAQAMLFDSEDKHRRMDAFLERRNQKKS
ncbi:MAG: enoyl-CoA hydratase/isomerase family protein, partial [Planctomycetes bacterium]|nr:enoyl-CoA hydratase/isomerase family protein [Planctomycetota bacterium]